MTYPPGQGFGGDPHGYGQQPPPQEPGGWGQQPQQDPQGWGQQPQHDPAWGQQPPPAAPAYGAQPGWDQPGYGQQQPGWDQQGYPPPQSPKPNTGLIIGLVVAVVAALVLVVGAVVVVNRKDDSNQAAVTSTTTTTTTAATTTTETTTRRPTTTQPASNKLTYSEYDGDWNFRLGDVALQAQWVQGKDETSCAPIEEAGKLTSLGCKYAAQLTWKAEGGAIVLTQFIVGMGDEAHASAAVDGFEDADVKLGPGMYVEHWETGKWRNSSEKEFLVITFATATATVPTETVEKYLKYRHNDTTGALLFR